jgi:hypothetical protein
MPFQMRDETAGVNILYIDNSGNAGLGSLPNSGQSLSVQGTSVVNNSGLFAAGLAGIGSALTAVGSVNIPPNTTSGISVAYAQIPTVNGSVAPTSVSTTSIQWQNTSTTVTLTVTYSLW